MPQSGISSLPSALCLQFVIDTMRWPRASGAKGLPSAAAVDFRSGLKFIKMLQSLRCPGGPTRAPAAVRTLCR
eukprot:946258-Prymnesium_polylepis.1